jgi:RNA polymerase sigma-70 factor, ECF subfamily
MPAGIDHVSSRLSRAMHLEPTDEQLCERVAAGDSQAFELLVERFQGRAYRLACSILGNEADARDVSQDAFIRLYESAGKFDNRSTFSTWFHRILVNICIDHQRRAKWWRRLLPLGAPAEDPETPALDPPSDEPGPDVEAIRGQTAGEIRRALDRLSPNQRAAMLMQVEGLSSREISEVLGCSENTARVHIHRAVTELRKTLKDV